LYGKRLPARGGGGRDNQDKRKRIFLKKNESSLVRTKGCSQLIEEFSNSVNVTARGGGENLGSESPY